ncbi:MAG: hypothetical protein D4R82_03205 [Dehalococcoidia bacterium]|nr:MAG: hypothetical protein D4R82_03205 [Dehalococcoidia bacterium]
MLGRQAEGKHPAQVGVGPWEHALPGAADKASAVPCLQARRVTGGVRETGGQGAIADTPRLWMGYQS